MTPQERAETLGIVHCNDKRPDIEKLIELARAAYPGPWTKTEADEVNPAAILELCDYVQAIESEYEKEHAQFEVDRKSAAKSREWVAILDADNAKIRLRAKELKTRAEAAEARVMELTSSEPYEAGYFDGNEQAIEHVRKCLENGFPDGGHYGSENMTAIRDRVRELQERVEELEAEFVHLKALSDECERLRLQVKMSGILNDAGDWADKYFEAAERIKELEDEIRVRGCMHD